MKNQLRRLRLREGDIVLVRDRRTMEALADLPRVKGIPPCPIVFCPGSVHRLSKEYLRKLLDGGGGAKVSK